MDPLNPELIRGSIDLMVLSALSDGAKYGYLIQQRLKESSGELVDLKAGTLYPILHKLELDKFVKSKWDDSTGRRRKWYELTASGKKRLIHRAKEWRDYVACLENILNPVLTTLPQGT